METVQQLLRENKLELHRAKPKVEQKCNEALFTLQKQRVLYYTLTWMELYMMQHYIK